jgi:hypothetical protein
MDQWSRRSCRGPRRARPRPSDLPNSIPDMTSEVVYERGRYKVINLHDKDKILGLGDWETGRIDCVFDNCDQFFPYNHSAWENPYHLSEKIVLETPIDYENDQYYREAIAPFVELFGACPAQKLLKCASICKCEYKRQKRREKNKKLRRLVSKLRVPAMRQRISRVCCLGAGTVHCLLRQHCLSRVSTSPTPIPHAWLISVAYSKFRLGTMTILVVSCRRTGINMGVLGNGKSAHEICIDRGPVCLRSCNVRQINNYTNLSRKIPNTTSHTTFVRVLLPREGESPGQQHASRGTRMGPLLFCTHLFARPLPPFDLTLYSILKLNPKITSD